MPGTGHRDVSNLPLFGGRVELVTNFETFRPFVPIQTRMRNLKWWSIVRAPT